MKVNSYKRGEFNNRATSVGTLTDLQALLASGDYEQPGVESFWSRIVSSVKTY